MLEWAARAADAGDKLDLSEYDLTRVDLKGVELTDIIFGYHKGAPERPTVAQLAGASFRDSTLVHCFFPHADLTDADFRHSTLRRCDFRYAELHRTTLEEAGIELCDFYRATIRRGTVMLNTSFELVSLTASLEGATDLRWSGFSGERPGLVSESEPDYRRFLEETRADRLETYSIDDAVDDRLEAAARTYRNLVAHWSSRGLFGDAGRAYVRTRRLERQQAGWRFKGKKFRPATWLWLWLADGLCGFGERLWPIVFWLAGVALLPGFLYAIFGGVTGAHNLGDDLLFSLSELTAVAPGGLAANGHAVDLVGAVQRILGIGFLGLFGFVLGNKLRSS